MIARLKEAIRNNKTEFWSDAELAFGKLKFSSFGGDARAVLRECSRDFGNALSEYLKTEVKRFAPPSKELRKMFLTQLCSYYKALGEYPGKNELERLRKFRTLKINVIVFNYTETFDAMLPQTSKLDLPGWGGGIQVQVDGICHVHGALSTEYTRLFGVNDRLQVHDDGLSDDLKDSLVKSTIDRWAGCGLEPAARAMIGESDTVIVFGMSMGETDKIWWKYLLDYLRNSSNRRICLAQHVKCQHGEMGIAEEAEWAQVERKRFYEAGEVHPLYSSTDELDRKIYVFRRGPYRDFEGNQLLCDPFLLAWFGKQLVSGAVGA